MKILVAEDEPISRRLIESSLQSWGFEPITCEDGTTASRLLLSPESPRMAILDWQLPGIDGIQLCRSVRLAGSEPYKYIVLLSSKSERDNVIEGLESGADDYISKPFDPPELKARLRTGQRICQLQDELIRSREKLRFEATHDHLTGLLNRAAILNSLQQELKRSSREGYDVSVAVADIDRFKSVNDECGHECGDELLKAIGDALRSVLRGYDSVGRFGGEEFLCVLPNCDAKKGERLANKLRDAVAATSITIRGTRLSRTLSVGVSSVHSAHCFDSLELIRRADAALYAAKQEGRNRVIRSTEVLLSN